MNLTEAEKNLLSFLRTRKPFEVVTIHIDKNGKNNFFLVNIQQRLTISDTEIREVTIK